MPVNYQINGDWHFTHYNNILFNIGLHNSPLKVKINLNIKQLNFTISNFFTIISLYQYIPVYVQVCASINESCIFASWGILPS